MCTVAELSLSQPAFHAVTLWGKDRYTHKSSNTDTKTTLQRGMNKMLWRPRGSSNPVQVGPARGRAWEPSGGGWTECWQAHVGAGQVTEGTRRRYRQGREGKSDAHRNQAFVQFSCPAGVYGEGAVKIRLVKSTGQCRNLEDVPFLNNLLQDGLQERNVTIIVRKEIKTNC